jgi:hypothetical protein
VKAGRDGDGEERPSPLGSSGCVRALAGLLATGPSLLRLLSLALLGHLHRPLELRRRHRQVAARRADVRVAEHLPDVMERHACLEPSARGFPAKVVEVSVINARASAGCLPRGLDADQPLAHGIEDAGAGRVPLAVWPVATTREQLHQSLRRGNGPHAVGLGRLGRSTIHSALPLPLQRTSCHWSPSSSPRRMPVSKTRLAVH